MIRLLGEVPQTGNPGLGKKRIEQIVDDFYRERGASLKPNELSSLADAIYRKLKRCMNDTGYDPTDTFTVREFLVQHEQKKNNISYENDGIGNC